MHHRSRDHHDENHESAVKANAIQASSPEHQQHIAAHPPEMHRQHGEHAEHDKHAGHSIALFRRKFWLSLILTIPTLVWGHMLQLHTISLSPWFINDLTDQSVRFIVTTL
jgi:hypothetical protein